MTMTPEKPRRIDRSSVEWAARMFGMGKGPDVDSEWVAEVLRKFAQTLPNPLTEPGDTRTPEKSDA